MNRRFATAVAVVALVTVGCGSTTEPADPGSPPGQPVAPDPGAAGDDPRWDQRPTPPAVDTVPDDDPPPPPPATDDPEPAPTGPSVPDEIAALFTVPSQVRIDDTGRSGGDGATEVVQVTGEFVGGDLAAAAAAFDTALADAGLEVAREPSEDGVVYVAPTDRATLAIALLADQGQVFVSIDLLLDRTA